MWTRCSARFVQRIAALQAGLCADTMTAEQLIAVNGKNKVLVFHMKMWRGDNEEDVGKKYASLGEEWDDLHSSIPTMKYTRIVTAEELAPGQFLFMCSCGFDFRYQGTCRHISLLLLHASDDQCAGCDIENIALRNTAAYAACRDAKLIQFKLWTGVRCGHVTEDSLRNCPCPCDEPDGEGDDHPDVGDDHHEDGSARRRPHHTDWIQRRDAK